MFPNHKTEKDHEYSKMDQPRGKFLNLSMFIVSNKAKPIYWHHMDSVKEGIFEGFLIKEVW